MFSIFKPKENDYVSIIPNNYDKDDSYIIADLIDYNLKGILPLTIVSNRKRVKNYKKYLKPGIETICKIESINNTNDEYKITLSYHYTDKTDDKYVEFIEMKKNIKNIKNVFLHLENKDNEKRPFNQLICEYFKPIEEKWLINQNTNLYKYFIENIKYIPLIEIINSKTIIDVNIDKSKKIGIILKDFNQLYKIKDILIKYNSNLILEFTPFYRYEGDNYDEFLEEIKKIENVLIKI
jgi:hypothetical protein